MPSTQDRRALQRFLEAGGVALATGSGLAFLPGAPAATRLDDGVIGRRRRFRALAPGPLTRETHGIEIEAEMNDPSERSPYVPVFADGETAGVLVARVGEGRAIWWTGSTPLLNTGIEETGHFELLLNALGPPGKRRILWDEHYHGHARSFWSYVAATPLPFALAQLGLLAVAALATYSRRRGPIQPVAVDTRASALEFVEAMASLYQRAGATAAAVDVARTRFRRLLGATAQVPSNAPDARLVKLTAARSGLDPNTVSALLSDTSRATHTSLPATDALALVQRLQDASASVRHRPQTDTDRNRQTQTKAGHRLHRQTQTDTDEGGAQTT
jgi:hypothetical protein